MEKPTETKNLQELAKKMLGKQLITNEDFQAGLTDIINAFAQYRSASQTINKETRDTLNLIVKQVNQEHDRILANVTNATHRAESDVTEASKKVEKLVEDCKKMHDEMSAMEMIVPENGKDADEELIIEEVLKRIPVEVEETPEEVRDKLETLNGEERLDIQHIKGWEKLFENVKGKAGGVVAGVRFLQYLLDVSITSPANNDVLKYNSTTQRWENGVGGSGGGHTIQDEGTPLTARANLNFIGAGVTVTDNAGTGATDVTIAGGSGSGDVVGPASSTDNALARFDSTTGKLLQNGVVTESDTGDLQAVNSVVFGQSPTGITTQGQMYWDSAEQTVSINVDQTNGVKLSLGTEQYIRVVNKTGIQINDGEVVYISGAQGNRPTATLARADAFSTTKVIGVATQNIANNAEGFVTTYGEVHGYNTVGFTAGDKLYLSASTAGLLVNTVPSSPNYNVCVGVALNSTVNGNIFIKPEAPIDLDTSLTDNSDLVVSSEKAVKAYVDNQVGTKYSRSINSISTPQTAGSTAKTDYVYLVSGTTTITMPTAVGNTNIYTIKNTGSAVVTVDTTSAQTIDGSATLTINVPYAYTLVSNNANWFIV